MDRTFSTDVDAVGALDVAGNLAHDDNFASLDAGIDAAVPANRDAAFGRGFAFNPAIDVERLGAADFSLDDQGTANGRLIYGSGDVFCGVVSVGVGSRGIRT